MLSAWATPLFLAACGSEAIPRGAPTPPPGTGHTGAASATGDTSGPAATADTGTPPPWDCAALPPGPLSAWPADAIASEDITMDADGHLVGADLSIDRNLWRTDAAGKRSILVPGSWIDGGIRLLPDGDLVGASSSRGALFRIDTDSGGIVPILGGLAWPNGIEVDGEGRVWFTEFAGDRVNRFDPATEERVVLSEGVISSPNGLARNIAGDRLYVASNHPSRLYVLPIDPRAGTAGPATIWAELPGDAETDGLAVDACDNLYVLSWSERLVRRFGADGTGPEILLDAASAPPGPGLGLGNMAWGTEVGGWDPTHVWIVNYGDQSTIEVDLGVGAKGWR